MIYIYNLLKQQYILKNLGDLLIKETYVPVNKITSCKLIKHLFFSAKH